MPAEATSSSRGTRPGPSHHLVGVHLDHADAGQPGPAPSPVARDGSCRSRPHPPTTTPDRAGRQRRRPAPSRLPTRRPARSSPAGAVQPWRPRPPTDATAPRSPRGGSDHGHENLIAGAVPTSWRTTSETSTSPPAARPAIRAAALTAPRADRRRSRATSPVLIPNRTRGAEPASARCDASANDDRLTWRHERQQQPVTQRLHHRAAVRLDALHAPPRAGADRSQSRRRRRPDRAARWSLRHRRTRPSSAPGPTARSPMAAGYAHQSAREIRHLPDLSASEVTFENLRELPDASPTWHSRR